MDCCKQYMFEVKDMCREAMTPFIGGDWKFLEIRTTKYPKALHKHFAYQQNKLLFIEDFEDIRRQTANRIVGEVKWLGKGRGGLGRHLIMETRCSGFTARVQGKKEERWRTDTITKANGSVCATEGSLIMEDEVSVEVVREKIFNRPWPLTFK